MLIEVTGVEELVEKLKKGKFVSKQDILTKSRLGSSSFFSANDLHIVSETSHVGRRRHCCWPAEDVLEVPGMLRSKRR